MSPHRRKGLVTGVCGGAPQFVTRECARAPPGSVVGRRGSHRLPSGRRERALRRRARLRCPQPCGPPGGAGRRGRGPGGSSRSRVQRSGGHLGRTGVGPSSSRGPEGRSRRRRRRRPGPKVPDSAGRAGRLACRVPARLVRPRATRRPRGAGPRGRRGEWCRRRGASRTAVGVPRRAVSAAAAGAESARSPATAAHRGAAPGGLSRRSAPFGHGPGRRARDGAAQGCSGRRPLCGDARFGRGVRG